MFIEQFESNELQNAFNCITGRQMYLTDRQEDRVVRFILAMSKIGKGFSKQELPGIVKSVLDRAEKDGLID